jgi:hypothetical protein
MGLVPLILKEIAWPDRRIVYIPQQLKVGNEILVRAFGLIPIVKSDARLKMLHKAQVKNVRTGMLMMVFLIISVLASYTALVAMEVYSKRSSLGCPYPAFVCTWFVLALIPAGIGKPFPSQVSTALASSKKLNGKF